MDPTGGILSGISSLADIGVGIANTVLGQQNADRNYNMQREVFDYQKQMQQQAWAREDNATQRRVNDLKAAGLSPVLAAGSAAASSSPISVNAPQRQYVPAQGGVQTAAQAAMAMMKMKQDISVTEAQEQLLRMQTQRTMSEIDKNIQDIEASKNQNEILRYNADYKRKYGLPSDATRESQEGAEATEQILKMLPSQMKGPAAALINKVGQGAKVVLPLVQRLLPKAPMMVPGE